MATPITFGVLDKITFPFVDMGNVNSLNLFEMDEFIIFSFYWQNRNRYRRVADLGANLGLHTIAMQRCGFEVICYEPDPDTFAILKENIAANASSNVTAHQAAISNEDGEAEFVRLHGNRTGSHLAGAKSNLYGEIDRFPVKIHAFAPIADWADLIKIDVEGHEAKLIETTNKDLWQSCDVIMEVGTPQNADIVYNHLNSIGVNMFSQKTGWRDVRSLSDMPTSHQEGSLFVTIKPEMPWG